MSHALDQLFATIAARRQAGDAANSYTSRLLSEGVQKCAKKFGEESVEAVIAAVSRDKRATVSEVADVLYHLLVLLKAADVTLEEVMASLDRRTVQTGLEEKAGRKS